MFTIHFIIICTHTTGLVEQCLLGTEIDILLMAHMEIVLMTIILIEIITIMFLKIKGEEVVHQMLLFMVMELEHRSIKIQKKIKLQTLMLEDLTIKTLIIPIIML